MENVNSVCYVAKIDEIKEIPGADNIEQAIIGGWSCIVKKGSHSANELVICTTTDAVIPEDLSDALGVTNYLRKGGRVRTVKLRGVYSESLIIPISFTKKYTSDKIYEGKDMMGELGIYKYEPPVKQIQLSSGRKIRYQDNPNFHVYYKFPNLKNVPGMFTEDDTVEITRKIHGTNARYGIVKKAKLSLWDKIKRLFGNKWVGYEFVVGSHNVEKGSDSNGFYDTNVWYEIADKYNIKNKLWSYVKSVAMTPEIGDGITIYGEIYGAGIQKGYDYGLEDIKFAGFDVKENGEYLDPINAKLLIKDILQLPYVEILYFGNWSQEIQDKFVFNNFIEINEITITDFKEGDMKGTIKTTKIPHEGIVIKHESGHRQKVAKVINSDYLIFAEKHNVEDSH
jgi:RNA ligase (TIGR02306 family)